MAWSDVHSWPPPCSHPAPPVDWQPGQYSPSQLATFDALRGRAIRHPAVSSRRLSRDGERLPDCDGAAPGGHGSSRVPQPNMAPPRVAAPVKGGPRISEREAWTLADLPTAPSPAGPDDSRINPPWPTRCWPTCSTRYAAPTRPFLSWNSPRFAADRPRNRTLVPKNRPPAGICSHMPGGHSPRPAGRPFGAFGSAHPKGTGRAGHRTGLPGAPAQGDRDLHARDKGSCRITARFEKADRRRPPPAAPARRGGPRGSPTVTGCAQVSGRGSSPPTLQDGAARVEHDGWN